MSYWGKYKAFVRDVEDPQQRGRIRVYCPAVVGTRDDKTTWLDWALPCFPAKSFFLPDKGDGVWVEFEDGNSNYPVWVGCWLAGKDKDSSEAPQVAKDEYPNNRVIRTVAGHTVEISDNSDNKHIKITHASGASINFDKSDKLILTSGSSVITVEKNGKITIDAGSDVEINGGTTPVAKEGSGTTGHQHTLTGTAGPYPIVGTAITTTDSIAVGAGSQTVKVP